jgi:HlyD family type I secretion membrane fusion protein
MTQPDRWPVMRYALTGALALAVLAGGFGGWALLAQINGAVIASGQIEVDRNRQIVQHPFGGIVDEILVAEGDNVRQGDLLIRLDATDLQSDLAIVESQLFELLATRARLESERDDTDTLVFDPILVESGSALMASQRRLFAARAETFRQSVDRLTQQRAQIASQIDGIIAQQAALATQRDLIARELADQQSLLARGLAQSSRVLALQREQANLLGRFGELTAQAAQAAERMTEIEIAALSLAATRREDAMTRLRDVQSRQIELTERRATLIRRLDRLDLRAPVSGVVYAMQVFAPRSVVLAADPLLYLIPQDRPLVIATQVQAIDIDQVFVGQDVTLRFAAFDQRRTPELAGRVTLVSADAFRNDTTGQSFYRAEVQLLPDELQRLPADMVLVPGMPVDAFLRTGDRSPMDYLVKPLSDYFAKAFRDG